MFKQHTWLGSMLNKIITGFCLFAAMCGNAFADYEQQLTCLADNAYFEARGEGKAGWQAVTNVVFNRMDHDKFPNTACEVVKQRRGSICQFSWVCSELNQKTNHRQTKLYRQIRTAVHHMYRDRDAVVDNTDGALFYHSTKVSKHAMGLRAKIVKTSVVGKHHFYKIQARKPQML